MRSLTLGTQVVVLLVAALLLMAVMAVTGYASSESLGKMVDLYQSTKIPALQALSAIGTAAGDAALHAVGMEDPAASETTHQRELAIFKAGVQEAIDNAAVYERAPRDDEEQRAWDSAAEHIKEWADAAARLEQAVNRRAQE